MTNRQAAVSSDSSRPKTALPYRLPQRRNLRLDDNQSLNTIRHEINRTFSGENKLLKEVRDLTVEKIGSRYANRIDRMCVQYSICTNPKRQKKLSDDIDVQFIAKKFIRNKSRQKQKEENKSLLRKSVGIVSRRYMKEEPQQFFKFDHDTLIKMEQKQKKLNIKSRREHPYLKLYEESQVEALKSLNDHGELSLGEAGELPTMHQADDWERELRHMKQIYGVIQNMRLQTARGRSKKESNEDIDHFYIT